MRSERNCSVDLSLLPGKDKGKGKKAGGKT